MGEEARLAAVARYGVLDTTQEEAFDRMAALAARMLVAPFATVSIVDADRIWFKATYGLDGVDQVDRHPGLSSSAIEQDHPYVVVDALTDPRTVANPLVHGEWGVRFYAAAPITTVGGHRLGVISVLDTRPRQISKTQLATLVDLAGVVMDELELRLSALRSQRYEQAQRARVEELVSTLQRTLLPPALPRVPGVQLACHYHTASASEVTGDFYDVFALDDRLWAFCLGDVTGHGASAAAVTSLTRYTLRTAALHHCDPAAVLSELNAALLLDPNVPQHCTVLFGLMAPAPDGSFEITLAGGGRPPALHLRPENGAVEQVWPEGGMLVGALPDAEFATCRVHLRAGQTLLLYTDGLTEACPGGQFFGEDRLRAFLAERTCTDAKGVIDELATLIDGFSPAPTDDVALLALSVPTGSSAQWCGA